MRWSIFGIATVLAVISLGNVCDAEDIVVATWNVEWFFDHDPSDNSSQLAKEMTAPSEEDYQWKLSDLAIGIAQIKPTILALQEIENAKVLGDLADRLKDDHGLSYQVAFVQGGDTYTEQDVGYLVQDGLEFDVERIPFEFQGDREFHNVSKHAALTVDIPTETGTERLWLLNVHLLASNANGRKQQARTIREWIAPRIEAEENVIVLGDINSGQRFEQTTPDSEVGIIRGFQTPTLRDDLFDLHQLLAGPARGTHITGRHLDRILISEAATVNDPSMVDLYFKSVTMEDGASIRGAGKDRNHSSGYWEIEESERDVSDHFPVVTVFGVE